MEQKNTLSISELSGRINAGQTSSGQLVDTYLDRISSLSDQGRRTYTCIYEDKARASARAQDELLKAGIRLSPLAGIPLSIKDLFDVEGEETLCGASVASPTGPAVHDAYVISRLREAGAVLIGKTNMSPYALSGVGRNLYHGTPGNPYDRTRIPGGSSSGAAVSVAEGMAAAAIGSDTGGSVRIPAALCGLVGFKPTQCRVPLTGVRPLSWSLDSVGPLAVSVDCCHVLDAIMAGERSSSLLPTSLRCLRLGVPNSQVLENLDPQVARMFDDSLQNLSRQGVQIVSLDFPEISAMTRLGGISRIIGAEAFTVHRDQSEDIRAATEGPIGERIAAGAEISAADYLDVVRGRSTLINSTIRTLQPVDAIAMPTVPILAPTLESLEDESQFYAINKLLLQNTAIANFLNLCSITLPASKGESLPRGFMLMALAGRDQALLSMAKAMENLLAVQE
jgi:aspartyl-tRNA(Asn)/glutamyl-tRNA(Gln) amidotransferase subunit A